MSLPGLGQNFFCRDTAEVARDLLGVWLLHQGVGGVLVETEAYRDGDDPASHAYRGPTPRNRVMFQEPGRAYVYFIYGNHFCLNVVAHAEGRAGAVLLRGLEPRVGLEEMARRRGREQHLTNGPGRLCQALGVDRRLNGVCMLESPLKLELRTPRPEVDRVASGPRIGIRHGLEQPLRFRVVGSPDVSRGGR